MKTDIEIAQAAKMKPIGEIAEKLGVMPEELEPYGRYKAKLSSGLYKRLESKPDGKLVLVTAINPTPAGEGKTTTSVGLGMALSKIGKNAIIALREPSLGPVFGMKGGAAGGGYAQVVPMEDINLHFTGDIHAMTAANNLLCALLDNHLQQGNKLQIDTRRILFKRCLDMNDRALRFATIGLGGKANGVPREEGFQITVASEVMAILCLATSITDLKERLGKILIAYNTSGGPVYACDLKAEGAMTALLKDALNPNLVQTLENTPVLIHGGPFANIAHGCNSLSATKLALKLADYTVTEAGFGSDLGAEKFFDIKCRYGGLSPSAVVLVATVRALKYNGGVKKDELNSENVAALTKGLINLEAHIENMRGFGLPVVVAINRFPTDTETEMAEIYSCCEKAGVVCKLSDAFAKGCDGAAELAEAVVAACEQPSDFKFTYSLEATAEEKIRAIATKIYGADNIELSAAAKRSLRDFAKIGLDKLPVCIAKTQYSLSDDPKRLGRPSGFTISVREIRLSAGAGFLVAITGDIMTMPGLPKIPAAEAIDVDENGNIMGLF